MPSAFILILQILFPVKLCIFFFYKAIIIPISKISTMTTTTLNCIPWQKALSFFFMSYCYTSLTLHTSLHIMSYHIIFTSTINTVVNHILSLYLLKWHIIQKPNSIPASLIPIRPLHNNLSTCCTSNIINISTIDCTFLWKNRVRV